MTARMSASGFICPECKVDLGSVDGLTRHFSEAHQAKNQKQPLNVIKKVLKIDSDLPSQKGKTYTT